jgi:hypothetical protein
MDEVRANKALKRIRDINPGFSEEILQNMKKELINLLNGETVVKVTKESPHISASHLEVKSIDVSCVQDTTSSFQCPKNHEHMSNNNITSHLSVNDQDDISVITEPSVSQENHPKAKTMIEPMAAIPEKPEKPDTNATEPAQPQSEAIPGFDLKQHHVKKCFECSIQKSKDEFTPSQWKRTKGSGRCVACVSKCAQWQLSNISSANLQTKVCFDCQQHKKYPEFTHNQWRRRVGTGRCRECVEKGVR